MTERNHSYEELEKRFTSLLLAIVLCLTLGIPALAAEEESVREKRLEIVDVNGYSFPIEEETDENYVTVRKFTQSDSVEVAATKEPAAVARNVNETKALLAALGMSDELIADLSEESLQVYATSREIVVTDYYLREDADGTRKYLPKEVAQRESENVNQMRLQVAKDHLRGITTQSNSGNGTFNSGYLHGTISWAYRQGAEYYYSVDVNWTTLPQMRSYDAIGVSSTYGSTTLPSGYYSYTSIVTTLTGTTSKERKEPFTPEGDANGRWLGYCGEFQLPKDIVSQQSTITNQNFKAHIQCYNHMGDPNAEQYFNVQGSYGHSTEELRIEPSVSLDSDGKVTLTISASLVKKLERYGKSMEVHYTPT